ncbi:response regulator [Pseudodesulfovibrio portus]|uniref:Two-component system response regulator n=1 Tax=Pseudodesulfovibrio portus TaxID=231439 RepID=A0ABM8AUP5_9BACT|nr:response regulator [Pseudodesulfovibrio portus]BDQ35007.1 two-component system response regulator [Pseudodesulfovibrio portus]
MTWNGTCRPNVRLLIVDDETGYAEVLCKRMARRGVSATPAASGEEAIRILYSDDFDVAIVDLKLEGMDGVEILKVFKLMAPDMPVVMLTGHSSEEARDACMKLGAEGYLSKPIDFERLLIKTLHLGGRRADA